VADQGYEGGRGNGPFIALGVLAAVVMIGTCAATLSRLERPVARSADATIIDAVPTAAVVTTTVPSTTVPATTAPATTAPATTVPATTVPATSVVPPTTAAPQPSVAITVSAPDTPSDPIDRVLAAYRDTIPDKWKAEVPVHYEVRAGSTSLSYPDGLEAISSFHATGSFVRLEFVIGHEFGHQIAFKFGSGAYNGAAPAGWPGPSDPEAWADCVGVAFTGRPSPIASHQCPEGAALTFTVEWLADH
jgi:hypothetical protein